MLLQNLNQKLAGPVQRLSNQRYLRAIKMGYFGVLPFLIASGLFVCIALILERYSIVLSDLFVLPYHILCVFTFLWNAYGIGSSLSSDYHRSSSFGGMYSLLGTFFVLFPWVLDLTTLQFHEERLLMAFFPSLILAIGFAELNHLLDKIQFKMNAEKGYPEAVSSSLNELIPLLGLCLVSFFLVSGSDAWIPVVHSIGAFVTGCFATLPGALLVVGATCFFWMFGVHGATLVGLMARPFWFYMVLADSYAILRHVDIPYITPESFFQWFVWIGGSGCTIGLVLCMRFGARSQHMKSLGNSCTISTFFNINEPVIFGTPIALNPILMVPFLLAPIGCCMSAYMAIESGLMNAPALIAPWILPAPLGALWASGDLRAILMSFLLMILSMLIYLPFFFYYDRKLWKQEQ